VREGAINALAGVGDLYCLCGLHTRARQDPARVLPTAFRSFDVYVGAKRLHPSVLARAVVALPAIHVLSRTRPIRAHWKAIRAEAIALLDANKIQAAAKYNDIGFNSLFRRGWRRCYLKRGQRPHRRIEPRVQVFVFDPARRPSD
jgi:hypothetical protein